MRILAALGGPAAPKVDQLASLAREHELIVSHRAGFGGGRQLRLALRNALPDRDVVTVVTHVVVDAGDPGTAAGAPRRSAQPRAFAELRSLRALIGAGSLVFCSIAEKPVAVDGIGEMRGVDVCVDESLTAALLARRLDADLLLMLGDGQAEWRPAGHLEPRRGRR
jgi:carbamate kinase